VGTAWVTLRLLGAIEIHCNRTVHVSLNTNPNPNPNPNPDPDPKWRPVNYNLSNGVSFLPIMRFNNYLAIAV